MMRTTLLALALALASGCASRIAGPRPITPTARFAWTGSAWVAAASGGYVWNGMDFELA